VTDPTHPLFGQRFSLRRIGNPERGATHVFVAYREQMTLRIPIAATTLFPTQPRLRTKLTLESVQELVTLAEQVQVACLPDPLRSGDSLRQPSSSTSATNSPSSSKRS
jgi:hypothetical protein